MQRLSTTLQVRTSPAQRKKLAALQKRTGITEADLVRYAIHQLPTASDLVDGEAVVDLIERVHGFIP